MVTGDNPLTAAAIAAEAGVDDVIAEATRRRKPGADSPGEGEGRLWRCGDGANDAPALAQADAGMAMNDGTCQAAREAVNLVDLDSDPTKLLDVVQVGRSCWSLPRRADHLPPPTT